MSLKILGTTVITRRSTSLSLSLSKLLTSSTSSSASSVTPRLVSDPKDTKASPSSVSKQKRTNALELEAKRTAFARELFTGRFDTDVLTFPEVLDKERHEMLHNLLEPIEKFFKEQVDSKKIDQEAKLPESVLSGLKALGLFGQQVPEEFGGLGLNATEYARIAEVVAKDGAIGVTLAAHQAIGLKGLLLYGTDDQKAKYLPKLASGEWIAAFALTEPSSGSDAASVQTKATLSKDGKSFILNGSKIWISNGGIADFYTVFAQTSDDKVDARSSKRLTAFAVERSFGGITTGKPEDKLGIRGSNTCEVHFENTVVPAENIIGEIGGGFKVAVNILNSGRFSMGSAGAGILRELISSTTEHTINRQQFGKSLSEFGLIREKLARMTMSTYAMESMAYLTAGLIDSNKYQDCAVEAAMVKVFSSEACWEQSSECLQILGGLGYMKDYPYERALRDSRIMMIFEGTNEILRLFIALMGVQHAGLELRELVKKIRNPFLYPGFVFKKVLENWRQGMNRPKMTLRLKEYLHPSLQEPADQLEHATQRLQFAVETALRIHGAKITDSQLILKRIADISIDIYAMTSVLARSSRAYCTGIRNGDLEMMIASAFCQFAFERIQKNVDAVVDGKFVSGDERLMEIAGAIVKGKGYCVEHPLTRNIW